MGGLIVGSVFGLVAGPVVGLMFGLGTEPQAVLPRQPSLRELVGVLKVGLKAGFTFGLAGGLLGLLIERDAEAGISGALFFGFVGGVAGGLTKLVDVWAVPQRRAATATPVSTYHIDRRSNTGFGLVLGLVYWFGIGLVLGPRERARTLTSA